MYALAPQAAEPWRDVVHYSEFGFVGVADAVDYEPPLVHREVYLDFIGLGDSLVAYLAYVFSPNLL